MKKYFRTILYISLFSFSVSVFASELNVDARAMYDRMDRLERDITLIQRKLYKGGQEVSADVSETTTAPEGSLQHLYAKINELELLVAQMTSQMEEEAHKIAILQEEFKKVNADIDFRLNEMKEQMKPSEPIETKKKEDVPKNAKTAYDEAYNFLKQLKYDEAEQAFQSFLNDYPQDELAGNAQYWLGETYYVRGQYESAAIAFATGFKNYKQNTKAADNLLKLGLSMQQLGKKKEACTAFKSLKKEFPKASDLLLSRAQKESDKLGCDK